MEVVIFVRPVPYYLSEIMEEKYIYQVFSCFGRKKNAAGCRTSRGISPQGVGKGAWHLGEKFSPRPANLGVIDTL